MSDDLACQSIFELNSSDSFITAINDACQYKLDYSNAIKDIKFAAIIFHHKKQYSWYRKEYRKGAGYLCPKKSVERRLGHQGLLQVL